MSKDKGLSPEQLAVVEAVKEQVAEQLTEKTKGFAKSEDLSEVAQKAIDAVMESEDIATIKSKVEEMAVKVGALVEGKLKNNGTKSLREFIEENSETLKAIKASKSGGSEAMKAAAAKLAMDVSKATEVASDIGDRDYLGEVDTQIGRKPVRRTVIMDLFRRKAVGTEYLHYWEENVVTRDAKNVVACATSTHTTKKTWAKRTVELCKIRDMVDICIDMLEDYAFVESEMRQLVEESIKLKAEYDLLLETGTAATDMLSLTTVASVFNPSNALAVYANKFQAPTIGDLTAAMKGQIYTFGAENQFMANVVLMNYNDVVTYLHAKDANNAYLFPNFVSGSTNVVNGMTIVTSPLVAQNTLFVFDSTKGSILDRKQLTITASFENNDNIEHEIVTFVGHERLQFHVRNIDRDAFLKCTDIEAALVAIAKT